MSTPFIGEIRMFGGTFPPAGWEFCQGQLVPIAENDALFLLIGTTYGGDGQETFALPDLQGRVPLHAGTPPGRQFPFELGEKSGVETVTLTLDQIPSHTHALVGADAPATTAHPGGNLPAEASKRFYLAPGTLAPMAPNTMQPSGGSQPHDNMQPFLCVSFIIATVGIFPSQT